MADYKKGEKVEYRPVGGGNDNVSTTTGIITNVEKGDDGEARYTIQNDNTGKETTYQAMNIVGKA
ncbi:hypothetical protein EIP91_004391 [Steccherinum ochraceum]|uniref:Hypervirulence associated protein TUDOR domain-containing protein n=1 Tax=Steccherinum ochraceum TaxID=92696 RepID=A0A4R0RNH6_9APHY|nr:hypothetical protein EIP91_004391 [Steccherinum ochraceum]